MCSSAIGFDGLSMHEKRNKMAGRMNNCFEFFTFIPLAAPGLVSEPTNVAISGRPPLTPALPSSEQRPRAPRL
jgi:hypothetical protein